MNRASMGLALFEKDGDYFAFEKAMGEGLARCPGLRLVAYCLMPNHFHFVLWPHGDQEVSAYLKWVTMTFAQRWHAHRGTAGRGRLFQGRFKSFPIQRNEPVLSVCRYVERNPLRAGLVDRAEAWRWSSLGCRLEALAGDGRRAALLCGEWPVRRGDEAAWLHRVNAAESSAELAALRLSARRGVPYGADSWVRLTAAELGLESCLRRPGRPRKNVENGV